MEELVLRRSCHQSYQGALSRSLALAFTTNIAPIRHLTLPGHVGGAQETKTINRIVGFGLCFGGLTFFGILVGTISGQTRLKLETLRQGQNAPVVEDGHLVVAGYNRNMPALLRAMCYTHEIKLQQVRRGELGLRLCVAHARVRGARASWLIGTAVTGGWCGVQRCLQVPPAAGSQDPTLDGCRAEKPLSNARSGVSSTVGALQRLSMVSRHPVGTPITVSERAYASYVLQSNSSKRPSPALFTHTALGVRKRSDPRSALAL